MDSSLVGRMRKLRIYSIREGRKDCSGSKRFDRFRHQMHWSILTIELKALRFGFNNVVNRTKWPEIQVGTVFFEDWRQKRSLKCCARMTECCKNVSQRKAVFQIRYTFNLRKSLTYKMQLSNKTALHKSYTSIGHNIYKCSESFSTSLFLLSSTFRSPSFPSPLRNFLLISQLASPPPLIRHGWSLDSRKYGILCHTLQYYKAFLWTGLRLCSHIKKLCFKGCVNGCSRVSQPCKWLFWNQL